MKLPIQSAPVYRYNTCTPGYSPIEEGVNPAVGFLRKTYCVTKCGLGGSFAAALSICGSNNNPCINNYLKAHSTYDQNNCLHRCLSRSN